MPAGMRLLDRYILKQAIGTLAALLAIVISLMMLEHLPRLVEISRYSGHRGYVIRQTIVGLLPEYAGIGMLVGLYFAIALTARRMALRGELDVVEACGISLWRAMRMPLSLAGLVSVLLLVNQGWLMPAGERHLDEIGHRMAQGEFGHQLPVGEFVDLGSGNVLRFREVDHKTGNLQGLFLRTDEQTFTAEMGRLSILPSGVASVLLSNGQAVGEHDGRILHFRNIRYRLTPSAGDDPVEMERVIQLRKRSLSDLLQEGSDRTRSAAYGRFLWTVLALMLPAVAFVLGKPPRRAAGAVGIIVGLAWLVLCLKMIGPLTDGASRDPELAAVGIALLWAIVSVGLLKVEGSLGQGFVDRWAARLAQRSLRYWKHEASESSHQRAPGKTVSSHSAPPLRQTRAAPAPAQKTG